MLIRRTYYDAEPIYVREQMPNWYQQLPTTNAAMQTTLKDYASGRNALQVGCGGAWLGSVLLEAGVKSYTGFDFSETAVRNAQLRLKKFKNARVFRADALAKTSYDGNPDLIVAHQFAQCLIGDDRKIWLENVRSALDPANGIFIVSTLVGIPEGLVPTVDLATRVNKVRNRYFAEDSEFQAELLGTGFMLLKAWYPEANMAIYIARPAQKN